MQPPYKEIWDEIVAFFVKYVSIPGLTALMIKLSVQVKNKSTSVRSMVISLIVGLSMAYLCKGVIYDYFNHEGVRTLLIAFVAIMADKVAEYFIYKTNVDKTFDLIGKTLILWIRRKFKGD